MIPGYTSDIPFLIFLIGCLIGMSLFVKTALNRLRIPPLVGWIGVGLLCRILDNKYGFLSEGNEEILHFLSQIGIFTLLFKIGLESKMKNLLKQFRKASFIGIGNILISGLVGFAAMFYIIGLSLAVSIMVGIALTATSVGVSVNTWKEAGVLDTSEGALLVDIAEIDDILSILLVGFLFAVIPVFRGNEANSILLEFLEVSFSFAVRMTGFILLSLLFARYIEKPVTGFIKKQEHEPDSMLTIMGIGFIIASIAAMFGLSLAIGAFFAGLAFCRDPRAVKMEASFDALYELFSPFFFIGIGLNLVLENLSGTLGFIIILFPAAVLGKLLGTALPALVKVRRMTAVVLGVSMIPRAEIAMVVMMYGKKYGDEFVSPQLFSSVVVITTLTCLFAPPVARLMLERELVPNVRR